MAKPEVQQRESVKTTMGYQKSFWGLAVVLFFAVVCLIHIQNSRAKPNEVTLKSQITVERIPSAEARRMGVDTRNN